MTYLEKWRADMGRAMDYRDRYGVKGPIPQIMACKLLGYERKNYWLREKEKRPLDVRDELSCMHLLYRVRQGLEPLPPRLKYILR